MKLLREFREFLLQGNILTIAIAFVIGTAFALLVASFVDNLIMPIVAAVIGKPDFRDLTFTINDSVFRYGSFFNAVLTFVLVAAAIFFVVVKPYNIYMERRRAGLEPEPPAAKSDEVIVLEEIRELMRTR